MNPDSASNWSRRSFLKAGAIIGATSAAAAGGWPLAPSAAAQDTKPQPARFQLADLPYPKDALEPVIDAETMGIHHGFHHAAYVTNLNKLLEPHASLQGASVEQLLAKRADAVPSEVRQGVINNAGGHANHTLFWSTLGPTSKVEHAASGKLLEAIQTFFTSQERLQEVMTDAGMKRFGSGWSWLVRTAEGRLEVFSTANQDSPLMDGKTPLLGLDVWEHAYYLKYRNRRADYLKAIWAVVDWKEVSRRFLA